MNDSLLRSHLECPICLNIPHRTRIFICTRGHDICQECFHRLRGNTKICPQGRCSYTKPPLRNLALESLVEDCNLAMNCPNMHDGCGFSGNQTDVDKHAASCDKGKVACPEENICHFRLALGDLVDHLRSEHDNVIFTEDIKRTSTQKWLIKRSVHMVRPSCVWNMVVTKFEGVHVAIRFLKREGLWCSWVMIFGNEAAAERLGCEIKLVSGNASQNEYVFKGNVHSVRTPPEDVLRSGSCLILTDDVIANCVSGVGISAASRRAGFDAHLSVQYKIVRTPASAGATGAAASTTSSRRRSSVASRSGGANATVSSSTPTRTSLGGGAARNGAAANEIRGREGGLPVPAYLPLR